MAYAGPGKYVAGEVGPLVDVEARQADMLLITIQLEGQETSSVLPIRPELRDRAPVLLQRSRGRPDTEVGLAEIPEA